MDGAGIYKVNAVLNGRSSLQILSGAPKFPAIPEPYNGAIAEPSPGMVFVDWQARFTPTREFKLRFFEKKNGALHKPDGGAH